MDRFRGLFDKLDRDNDGFISREELLSEMRRIGVEPVCEKVQVRFSTCINCRDKESFFLCCLSGDLIFCVNKLTATILSFRKSCQIMTKTRMDVLAIRNFLFI